MSVAHIARRIIHVSILLAPIIYYYFLVPVFSTRVLHASIFIVIFFVFLLEKMRLRARLVLFAQRSYEATHISAFAWTILSLGLVLVFSPSVMYSVPIVATCALVDPLLGEMRLSHFNKPLTLILGIVLALLIWIMSARHYHFPLFFAYILAPLSVLVEWPKISWIDDNALMMLVPLIGILILSH